MKRKVSTVLAVIASLAFASAAMAQDDTVQSFDLSSIVQSLSPFLGIVWFILFAAWGGFRWLY